MSNTRDVAGAVKVLNLPAGACFTGFEDFLKQLGKYLVLEIPNSITNVILSSEEPSSSQRNNVWFKYNDAGEFIGIYLFTDGAWTLVFPPIIFPTKTPLTKGIILFPDGVTVNTPMALDTIGTSGGPIEIAMPADGTATNLSLSLLAPPGLGIGVYATLYLNGASTGQTILIDNTITQKTKAQSILPVPFVSGDILTLLANGGNFPSPGEISVCTVWGTFT